MARPAPAVERTVALLEFLSSHPNEAFSLSELARRLEMNKATGHAMVAALTDAGYLLRHPMDNTYSLGPALIAVGNAAGARQFEVVDYARGEMDQLSRELRVQCVASAAIGDEIVLLARSGETEPLSLSVPVGQRLPLVPPLGTVFLAWESPDAIDRWLRRLGPRSGNTALDRYREAVATVRRRGYSLGLEPAPATSPRGRRTLRDAAVEVVEDHPHDEYILLELENAAPYRLSHIAAPVFGADGRVALALTLMGFRHQLSAGEVPEYAERLRDAALAVTRSIHGRHPNEATG